MNDSARWAICVGLAFLVGSIPFGVMIARAHGVDIRQHGSKNVGATNVWRVLGWRAGLACFLLDALKGAAPVAIAGWWMGALGQREISAAAQGWWMGVACAAALGHMFSPWLGFRGGKGVATGLGAMLALWPQTTPAAAGALLVFGVTAWRTRYVGVSSCAAAVAMPLLIALWRGIGLVGAGESAWARIANGWALIGAAGALGAVMIWKHRGNLARAMAGTERRIGERAPPTAAIDVESGSQD